jgi:hypothetical protein
MGRLLGERLPFRLFRAYRTARCGSQLSATVYGCAGAIDFRDCKKELEHGARC